MRFILRFLAGVDVASVSGLLTGSSVAASLMAGTAALLWVGDCASGRCSLSSLEIRNYFIRGAEREEDMEYPMLRGDTENEWKVCSAVIEEI